MKRDTLLIIDDSELDLAILNEIFKHTFEVKTLTNSSEATTFIVQNRERICAIILDICLGRQGAGFTVMERLQTDERINKLPIILITSDANEAYVMDGIAHGASDFLVKPVDPHTVQERVCNTIHRAFPKGETVLDDDKSSNIQKHANKQKNTKHTKKSEELPQSVFSLFPNPTTQQEIAEVGTQWSQRLELFCKNRKLLSIEEYKAIGSITALLAEIYVAKHSESGLTKTDVTMIGQAAIFHDIGMLALSDECISAGPEQTGKGIDEYFQHIQYGKEFFQTNDENNKFFQYCADIAYFHHKNYDGSGYPQNVNLKEHDIPLSAQLVHTALECSKHVHFHLSYVDYFDRMLESLKKEINKSISQEMYDTVVASEQQLSLLLRILYVGWL